MLAAFRSWLDATLPKLSRRSDLALGIRHTLARWAALVRYVDDGPLEIDNNAAERALRGVAIVRKNWLFAGLAPGRASRRRHLLLRQNRQAQPR